MKLKTELNPGEIKILFSEPISEKISFAEMGLKDEDMVYKSGHLRIVFDFVGIGEHNFFKMPTIEIGYKEEMGETHWQCDYNRTTILDKLDHRGHSTIVLLSRKKLSELEHRRNNKLILHAEFPTGVQLSAKDCWVHFFT